MALQNKAHSIPSNQNLGVTVIQFLVSLHPDDRPKFQQEVKRFVRWYGEERLISELTVPEIANYAEHIASSTTEPAKKLYPVKSFLSYAHKQKLTKTKLAVHIKIKKTSSKFSLSKGYCQKTITLTTQGFTDLESELTTLKNKRPRIADEIRKAASDKDYRENAPLDAAREHQGQVEARIRELESTLKVASLIEEKQHISPKVIIGTTIMLRDLVTGEQIEYKLVDASEANPTKGKISTISPIGKALLGREKGEKIEVTAPAGILPYIIEDIKQS